MKKLLFSFITVLSLLSTVINAQNAIFGCIDTAAANYDPNATVDDGSCTYGQQGGNNLEQKDVSNTVYFPVMANVKFSQLRNSFRVNTFK